MQINFFFNLYSDATENLHILYTQVFIAFGSSYHNIAFIKFCWLNIYSLSLYRFIFTVQIKKHRCFMQKEPV